MNYQIVILFLFSFGMLQSHEFFYQFPLEEEPQKIPVFTKSELENLKTSSSPIYIHYFDWKDYATSKKILKKGILFTYRNLGAKNVFIAGNFTNYKKIPMERNPFGVFYFVQPVIKIQNQALKDYYYSFYVDGIWVLDPTNSEKRLLHSQEYSFFQFEDPEIDYLETFKVLKKEITSNNLEFYLVEFCIHENHLKRALNKNEIQSVHVIGDFNYWNLTSKMIKDKKGFYRYQTYLPKGTYHYQFVVDGEWILDPLNPKTKYSTNFRKVLSEVQIP
ncbi:MAG: glycogen-binding domain-containing protein [Leptospiraceae bacterium]|nr:glycogen-binding domain-containing protein [Leptospiraceae bacterium]MDW7976948.1 glycogen-binding domain-containing protein [Leptospiraceae bacterium]